MSKMTKEEYQGEFALMVDELSCKEGIKYDALCRISESFLRPYIANRCYRYSSLRQSGIEDDIFHDVLIRLIKSCIDQFLYKDGTQNYDPEGFLRWIYTVARNVIIDTAKDYGAKSCTEVGIVNDDGEIIDIPSVDDPFMSIEAADTLKDCLRTVLSLDSSLHIVLTWIIRAILLARCDLSLEEKYIADTKINALVVKTFKDLTLNEIYAVILLEAKKLEWLSISEADNKRITRILESENTNGKSIGNTVYSEFFMKKGANATISDWVNRTNMRIIKAANAEVL